MKTEWMGLSLALVLSTSVSAAEWRLPWTRDEAVVAQAWPAEARQAGQGGRAVMRCHADAQGSVSDCRLVYETPSGAGFGAALLKIAPSYRVDRRRVGSDGLIDIVETWTAADRGPDWLRKPSAEQLLAVWPAAAAGESGRAALDCLVAPQGGLYDCRVVEESPSGRGFGDAALALAPQLLMKPSTLKGRPVFGAVAFPIKFDWGGVPAHDLMGGKFVLAPATNWTEAPTIADVAAAYPATARAANLGGQVTLHCQFSGTGGLAHCETLAEEPKHAGFREAALELAKHFRIDPARDPRIKSASVTLPVAFAPELIDGAGPSGKPRLLSGPDATALSAAMAKAKPTDGGRAVMTCRIEQGGVLGGCALKSENPPGKGVGATLLALSPKFLSVTWTDEGLPLVGSLINVPLVLQVEGGEKSPPPTPPASAPTPSRSGP